MDNLDEYMKYFKEQSLKTKQEIIIDELKMLTLITNKMCNELEAENEILLNKEANDVNVADYTEDDFAEAIISYICSIKNSLSDFTEKLTDISSNIDI
jgi:hypothetical protein